MEILGYIASLLVGISMGLIGGGGSLLAMPIFIYLFHINPLVATSYSLFLVGITSLIGTVLKISSKSIDTHMVLLFGIPDLMGVILMRKYLFPPIPGNLFLIGNHMLTKSDLVLIMFSILMIFAAKAMIQSKQKLELKTLLAEVTPKSSWFFIGMGLATGLLTGMVGAGGGFIIIPILVLWAGIPMNKAVGTSLAIIACKSLIGFVVDKINFDLDHGLIWYISALAVLGLFIGNILSKKIAIQHLQKGFGVLVIALGAYMLIHTISSIL